MSWATDVTCPRCGWGPGFACRHPNGDTAPRYHRARIVLSITGDKSAAAVARIEKILVEAEARGRRSTFHKDGQQLVEKGQ